jgi:hypothetical protein
VDLGLKDELPAIGRLAEDPPGNPRTNASNCGARPRSFSVLPVFITR